MSNEIEKVRVFEEQSIDGNTTMNFLEHFYELRRRIFYFAVAFIFCLIVTYFTAPYFVNLLKSSALHYEIELNVFKVTESVSIYAKTMLLQSVCISFPILIMQIYLFIKPTINNKLKKILLVFSSVVSILFLLGVILGYYFLTPLLFSFFLGVTEELSMNTMYNFSDYFQFVFMICLLAGLVLEIPALMVLLTQLGVISSNTLKKLRKILYPIFCIVAVILTPPDFISDITAIILLISIFEIGLVICGVMEKKTEKLRGG
ncbi:twin-arginine translocase subunit TatC [Paenibacillus sp. NPDC058910]|uniref:twin-arginine translocase subunit TatC n=1 Tax=unclassified Paenibacillus TaxID=185978 RepID=UPI00367A3FB1